MGAWGTGIFQDDTACDVRDEYRTLIGDGHSATEATNLILKHSEPSLTDSDSGTIVWLALAATQWKCGRLEERVKAKALAVINDGSNLPLWDEAGLRKRRQRVLAKLKEQLLSPQPPAKRIPKHYRDTCEWAVGEVIAFRLLSSKLVLLRIIAHWTDESGTIPTFELLDWIGVEVPPLDVLRSLKLKTGKSLTFQPSPVPGGSWVMGPVSQFMIARLKEKELPQERVQRLGVILPPAQTEFSPLCFFWKKLDQQLKEEFDLG